MANNKGNNRITQNKFGRNIKKEVKGVEPKRTTDNKRGYDIDIESIKLWATDIRGE